jgi:arylsulfatase A-like enzyme
VLGIHPLLVSLLITITGCGTDAPDPPATQSPQQALVTRLLAHAAEAGAGGEATHPPTLTIDHDTRPIAGAARSFRVLEPVELELDADGRVRLPFEPAAATLVGTRVVLEPTWRDEDGWHSLAPRPTEVGIDASGAPFVVLEEPERAGETLELYAKAHGPLPAGVEHVQLPPVDVPPDARLELAFGVLRLGDDASAFEYRIDACDEAPAGDGGGAPCVPLFAATTDGDDPGGWIDLQLPLDALAGRRVAFRLTSRPTSDGPASLAVPAWSEAAIWRPAAGANVRRNVILVSLDTLRADHLPSYGYPVDTAPFLEEGFAQRGTLFEQPVAAASSTASSHMSIFTGLDVLVHQVANMYRSLPDEYATVAERLRQAGYQTGAVTENGALLLSQGFGRGFASYFENKEGDVTSFEGQAEDTLALAEAWLRRHRDQPFFLFVHTYQVHYPYTPPPGYEALIPELPAEVAAAEGIPPERNPLLYDREIRYLDDLLRSFFGRIDDLGLDRDTVVIVTSDHGDEFYEHDYLDHGATVFNSAIHVPLLLRGPGIPAGQRIATPVGHVDLAPTILEIAGVAPAPDIAGRSLWPLVEGRAGGADALTGRPLYSETRVRWARGRQADGGLVRIETPTIGVRLGDAKAIRDLTEDGPRVRFYDLGRDPGEEAPETVEERPDFARLEYLAKLYPYSYKSIHEARVARAEADGPSDDGEDDSLGRNPDYEEELRALGYVE